MSANARTIPGIRPATRATPYPERVRCDRERDSGETGSRFFHHVPYGHALHSSLTVIQHIYDTHFAGLEEAQEMRRRWDALGGLVDEALFRRVRERLDEQVRSAREWRDQLNAYFFRESGVPDAQGRPLY